MRGGGARGCRRGGGAAVPQGGAPSTQQDRQKGGASAKVQMCLRNPASERIGNLLASADARRVCGCWCRVVRVQRQVQAEGWGARGSV
jgi:hypothetical protein